MLETLSGGSSVGSMDIWTAGRKAFLWVELLAMRSAGQTVGCWVCWWAVKTGSSRAGSSDSLGAMMVEWMARWWAELTDVLSAALLADSMVDEKAGE